MPDLVYGLDISNYDGVLSASLVQQWKDAGIGHVVVRCSLERQTMMDLTRQQLQALQAGGIGVSVYVWAYLDDGAPEATAQAAISLVDDLAPRCYWLDIEDDSNQGGPAVNCDWLRRCLAAFDAAGKASGIYTGLWFWGPYMGNSTAFADRPLWTADYDGVADLNVGHSYGGWALPFIGKQYMGSGTPGSGGRDRDVFDAAWLAQGSEDMGQIADLQAQLAERDSTIGALRFDIIYKARLLVDGAMARSAGSRERLQRARDLLASEERAT